MRLCSCVSLALGVAVLTGCGPLPGVGKSAQGGMIWTYANESGVETYTKGGDPAAAVVMAAETTAPTLTDAAQIVASIAPKIGCKDAPPAPVNGRFGPFGSAPTCLALAAPNATGGHRIVLTSSFENDAGADAFSVAERALSLRDGTALTTPAGSPSDAVAPEMTGTGDAVEAVFLHTQMVGTVMASDIIAVFGDGTWIEVGGLSPEDRAQINLSENDHGRWIRKGKIYALTAADDGEVTEFDADYAEPPFPNGHTLEGAWRSVTGASVGFGSGGGSILTNYLIFLPDGRFATSSDAAISITTGGDPGVSIAAGGEGGQDRGKYRISGHTLHLDYDSGDQIRMSIVEIEDGGSSNASTYVIGGRLYFTD